MNGNQEKKNRRPVRCARGTLGKVITMEANKPISESRRLYLERIEKRDEKRRAYWEQVERIKKQKEEKRKKSREAKRRRKQRQKISRPKVLEKFKYRCVRCGYNEFFTALDIDHIIPVSHGGINEISNLQVLCSNCHRYKTTEDNYKFGKKWSKNIINTSRQISSESDSHLEPTRKIVL